MIAVAGKPNRPTDPKGTYKKACAVLARDLGWRVGEVYAMWQELALMREFELRWPRSCAEWQAMHDVVACICKPGEVGS